MVKERPTKEELAKARASAQRALMFQCTQEEREMLQVFLRHTAPISEEEIAHAMVAVSKGEDATKYPEMISLELNNMRNESHMPAGLMKDVVDYLFGGRTNVT